MRVLVAIALFGFSLFAMAECAPNSATGSVAPLSNPTALRANAMRSNDSLRSLYSFKGRVGNDVDGALPIGELSIVNGALIGTTEAGGVFDHGSVFEVSTAGAERIVASISEPAAQPQGELINLAAFHLPDYFIGVSMQGGTDRRGSIFLVDANATFTASLYSFTTLANGINPTGGLAEVNGRFFGTTSHGGNVLQFCGGTCGTVYEFDASTNAAQTLYRFSGSRPTQGSYDGARPNGGLIAMNGTLYGTTAAGGFYIGHCPIGCGTVYEIRTDGSYRLVASFPSTNPDPVGNLVELNGLLYGVTGEPGYVSSKGTVFVVNAQTGSLSVLHAFTGADGADPRAALTVLDGKLFGTTSRGGTANVGTVFEVTPQGAFRVLHNFNGTDGANPRGALRLLGGVLYGTTENGGTGNCSTKLRTGCGTVFAVTP